MKSTFCECDSKGNITHNIYTLKCIWNGKPVILKLPTGAVICIVFILYLSRVQPCPNFQKTLLVYPTAQLHLYQYMHYHANGSTGNCKSSGKIGKCRTMRYECTYCTYTAELVRLMLLCTWH